MNFKKHIIGIRPSIFHYLSVNYDGIAVILPISTLKNDQ